MDAEEGAVDAKLICGDGQIDCLVQGLGRGNAVAGAVRVVTEAQESEVFQDVSLWGTIESSTLWGVGCEIGRLPVSNSGHRADMKDLSRAR